MKRFLNAFLNWFSKSRAPNREGFISRAGDVARFVFRPRDLYADGRPKPKAFQPEFHAEFGRFETSVCGLNGVLDERLWFLARTLRAAEGLSAIAALQIPVVRITETGLACEPAPEPDYPEHGVIVGWNPDPKAKDERLAQQVELVACVPARAVRRPPPRQGL